VTYIDDVDDDDYDPRVYITGTESAVVVTQCVGYFLQVRYAVSAKPSVGNQEPKVARFVSTIPPTQLFSRHKSLQWKVALKILELF
jgi:hypothetical protein